LDYVSLIANTGVQIIDLRIKLNHVKFRTLKFNCFEGLDSFSLNYWFDELIEIKNIAKFIKKSDLEQLGN